MLNHQMKSYLIFTLLGLATIFTSVLAIYLASAHHAPAAIKNNQPTQIMQGVQLWEMNQQGKAKLYYTAQKLTHYKHNNLTLMQQPRFIIYSQHNHEKPWHVQAVHGKAYHGLQKLYLYDHVRIRQAANQKRHATIILTSAITIWPKTHVAFSSKPVTIEQNGASIHAIGLRANLKQHWLKLLSHVQGEYNPLMYNQQDNKGNTTSDATSSNTTSTQ